MRQIRIAPSILAWDLGNLREAAEIASEGHADQLHLDVIDGHFAPNITFGPGTVKALRKISDLKFDTHLMVDEPAAYIEKFMDAGSDLLTLHAEVLDGKRFDDIHKAIKARGKEMGLAIKPGTEIPNWAMERMDKLSALIVMTVNPGFSGQKMDMGLMPKLGRISSAIQDGRFTTDVEVDGGVEPENVMEVVKNGGNVLVAGAGVYAQENPVSAIGLLRERAEAARRKA
jgi:transketolase